MAKKKAAKKPARKAPPVSKCAILAAPPVSKCAILAKQMADIYGKDPNSDRRALGNYYRWLSTAGALVTVGKRPAIPSLDAVAKKAELKECFDNADRVARKIPGVKIVLGQIAVDVDSAGAYQPVDHAWNVTEDGIHFDITAEALRAKGMGGTILEYYALGVLARRDYATLVFNGGPIYSLYERQKGN